MNAAGKVSALVLGLLVMLSGLTGCGEVRNPFVKEKPVSAGAYPSDLAIVIDEASDTYYARQNIRQVVTASDLMSRTTYTTLRDLNNTVASTFTHEQPVSQAQLQKMWDDIAQNNLMGNAEVWYFWKSNPDNYRRDERSIQIRANGKVATYKVLNHWGYKLRDLVIEVQAVRFPLTQRGAAAPAAPTAPATAETTTTAESATSTAPTTTTAPGASMPTTTTQP